VDRAGGHGIAIVIVLSEAPTSERHALIDLDIVLLGLRKAGCCTQTTDARANHNHPFLLRHDSTSVVDQRTCGTPEKTEKAIRAVVKNDLAQAFDDERVILAGHQAV